ncbi:mechanosensitive ion channel [Candidatus Woesearchaeota archaeon]|nr:mechanosensitive ion channel [Candidatus Woesearchaeota archaeon]
MMILNGTTTKLAITFLIIIIGYVLTRLGSMMITIIQSKRETITLKQRAIVKNFHYLVMIFTIIIALLYLKSDVLKEFIFLTNLISKTYELLPNIILIVLLIVLGIIIVNLAIFVFKRFFDTIGITEFMIEQDKEHVLNGILFFIRMALYLLITLILLNMFGVNVGGIISTLGFILYALLGLLLLYVFVGTRIFVENFSAGIYLRASRTFKLGQKVRVGDVDGKIKSISHQGITVDTDYGYNVFIPNKEFVKKEVLFKSIETDLTTLKKIKSYFVEQKPSYCGPASAAMILKVFGYNISQTKLGDLCKTKVGSGTHPNTLINVVEDLTKKKVRGAWIDSEHITDLKSEIRLWLNEGALLIVDYKKNILFPDSKKAHYAVVVAVEGDELVILDPSGKKGGVYLAETEKVHRGMETYSELIKGKRGYIAFAPEGTTAYYRIEEGLIYSDPSLYNDLSNKLKKELFNLTEKSEMLESVLPIKIKKFIRKWKEKEKIARLWRPERI